MSDNSDDKLIAWSPTFSCGIKIIDDQHKTLINLINDLYNHFTGNEEEERDFQKKVFEQMEKYIKVHFATEEKILNTTKFPGYALHKVAHDDFVVNYENAIRDFESRKRFSIAVFTRFLKDWVLSHIAVMDKQYFEYFKTIATRKTNENL